MCLIVGEQKLQPGIVLTVLIDPGAWKDIQGAISWRVELLPMTTNALSLFFLTNTKVGEEAHDIYNIH